MVKLRKNIFTTVYLISTEIYQILLSFVIISSGTKSHQMPGGIGTECIR